MLKHLPMFGDFALFGEVVQVSRSSLVCWREAKRQHTCCLRTAMFSVENNGLGDILSSSHKLLVNLLVTSELTELGTIAIYKDRLHRCCISIVNG